MIRVLAISLAVCIGLLLISLKLVMVYHAESVTANQNVETLTKSIRDAEIVLKNTKESCAVSERIVADTLEKNRRLDDETDTILDSIDKLKYIEAAPKPTPPKVKEVQVEKVIYGERLSPAMYRLLQQSYCETSGDTSPCSTGVTTN